MFIKMVWYIDINQNSQTQDGAVRSVTLSYTQRLGPRSEYNRETSWNLFDVSNSKTRQEGQETLHATLSARHSDLEIRFANRKVDICSSLRRWERIKRQIVTRMNSYQHKRFLLFPHFSEFQSGVSSTSNLDKECVFGCWIVSWFPPRWRVHS